MSNTITKRNGESGSPCLNPCDALKLPIGLPFIKTEKLTEEKHPMIQLLHLPWNPFLSST
ncbi:hypothetical protein LguiB_001662 [Lonicera macranthoides]